ncbi:hypothetical protein J6590_020648 [Homalodisca vitripennis]|nr:hypothetical protein J6590_020648 [Homalodisca vitripennis]
MKRISRSDARLSSLTVNYNHFHHNNSLKVKLMSALQLSRANAVHRLCPARPRHYTRVASVCIHFNVCHALELVEVAKVLVQRLFDDNKRLERSSDVNKNTGRLPALGMSKQWGRGGTSGRVGRRTTTATVKTVVPTRER